MAKIPSGLRAGSLEVHMVICGNVSDHDKSLTNASIVEFKTQDRAFIFLIVKPLQMTTNNLMKESFCVWARDIRVASVRSTTPFESSPPFSRRYQPAQKPSPLKTFLASNIPGSYANSCLGFRPRWIKDICQNSCFMAYIKYFPRWQYVISAGKRHHCPGSFWPASFLHESKWQCFPIKIKSHARAAFMHLPSHVGSQPVQKALSPSLPGVEEGWQNIFWRILQSNVFL